MQFEAMLGIGIAGNFAHHLEQAGEIEDFLDIITNDPNAPKGIFPFYVPNSECFLGRCPIANEVLTLPKGEDAQVEPEIVLLCDISYGEDMQVVRLEPKAFSTFNDCTIRKEGAKKISYKKNWSNDSKGIAKKWIKIDKFSHGGVMDNYHLCSYLLRDKILHPYGVDAPLLGYGYFYEKLIVWLIEKLNNQKDFGPLEDLSLHLKNANYPTKALVCIGATAYSDFGENNYLAEKDEIYVVAYDKRVDNSDLTPSDTKIILRQVVQN